MSSKCPWQPTRPTRRRPTRRSTARTEPTPDPETNRSIEAKDSVKGTDCRKRAIWLRPCTDDEAFSPADRDRGPNRRSHSERWLETPSWNALANAAG